MAQPAPQIVPPAPTARTAAPVRVFSVPQQMPSGRVADEAFLDQVVANWERHQAKGDPRFPKPPAYLIPQASVAVGHAEDQALARAYAERSDLPAVGWPDGLRREGRYLLATFKGVPVKLAEWMNAGAYKTCSAEFYEDYHGLGPCLRRVSILGADIPARKDLGDLPVLVFDPEDVGRPNPVAFTEALAGMAGRHRRWGLQLGPGPGRLVTFSEQNTGAPSMDPKYQALMAALQAAGVDPSRMDAAMLDQIMQACQPAAPAATPPAMHTEDDDKPKDPPAQFSETALQAILQSAVAAAVAPLQAQIKQHDSVLAGATARLAAADATAARASLAAFCETHRDRIFPFELDPKVGPTLIDQLLALPDTTVAQFAEGKVSPRQALMNQVASRPPIAKFAEKVEQAIKPQGDDVSHLLGMTRLGQAVLRTQAAKA